MDRLFYNSNSNTNKNKNDGKNNSINNNYQQNNQTNQGGNIIDDTPAILLEQLAYIDTFMPQLEEDIAINQNNNTLVQNSSNDMNFFNNSNNNNFDFMSNSLDDRLAEELKIFADESFIFPDEDKPENPDLINNSYTPNGMPNYNNNTNGIGILGENNQRQNKKDLRNKYLKTGLGNDDNKAFLKRHDYNSNNENAPSGYTPSVNSIQSSHRNAFNQSPDFSSGPVPFGQSPEFTNVAVNQSPEFTNIPTANPQQPVSLSEYHTNSLYTMLPRIQHDRYLSILSDLQRLQGQEGYINEWTLNFSLEEVALLLVFKEYYLPQLPVSMIQYDQFKDPEVVERELYKVLNMHVNESGSENVHSGAVKRTNSDVDTGSGSEESGKSRKSSLVEEDLETQVKKLIKISEKLQKKVTSLEVENKMLRNLVSKDGHN